MAVVVLLLFSPLLRGCWLCVPRSPVALLGSGFFKRLVTKTKNGFGKVRQSLSPSKGKAEGDSEAEVREVQPFLLWLPTAAFDFPPLLSAITTLIKMSL